MNIRLLLTAALASAALWQFALPAAAQAQPVPAPTATPEVQIPPALPPILKTERYLSAGYIVPPLVCNEISPCNPGTRYRNYAVRGALEFPISNGLAGMVKFDYRRFNYPAGGRVINLAGGGTAFAPALQAREEDYDFRAGIRALEPRLYLGVSYLQRTENYGYPRLRGFGVGLEKLPDVDQTFSVYGGAYYYPSVSGTYTQPLGPNTNIPLRLAYHVLRYDFGITLKPSTTSPVFVDAGYIGDRSRNADNAPSNITRNGPFVGLGVTF
ncbi:MAG: hypothetical protein NVSMB31_07430 [Vulcanimicrobiaceae bacterium]